MTAKAVYPEALSEVRERLGMTAESIRSDVAYLKMWMSTRPHFGKLTGVSADKWLENYLILNGNQIGRVKKSMEYYFKIKWVMPEMYEDRDMSSEEMVESFSSTCVASLPKLTPEGYRILVLSHLTDDASQFDPVLLIKRIFAMADICLAEGVDRTGTILIVDLHNATLGHIGNYQYGLLKDTFGYGWEAYPEFVEVIHIINPPHFLEVMLNLFKPFIKEKIKRIHVHHDLASLYKEIPKNMLPKDYGGDCPWLTDLNNAWKEKMIASRRWLEVAATHRSDGELFQSLQKCDPTRFQFKIEQEANFRKLTID